MHIALQTPSHLVCINPNNNEGWLHDCILKMREWKLTQVKSGAQKN